MRIAPLLILFFLGFLSCKNVEEKSTNATPAKEYIEVMPVYQSVLDSAGLTGSILIYNPDKRSYYSNDFQWARKGQLPASTFKIPNSIIALETGVITNEEVTLPWDGITRGVDNWNQDLTFTDAFAYSCVPCYQRIARDVGHDRMRQYLDRLEYSKGVQFDTSNIDMFWLVGEARINQFEQIEFLERLYEADLPISEKTSSIMRKIMVMDTTEHFILSGKTGWSNDNGKDNGWFVGFAQAGDHVLYFATNVEPDEGKPISSFVSGRRTVTEAAIGLMKWP